MFHTAEPGVEQLWLWATRLMITYPFVNILSYQTNSTLFSNAKHIIPFQRTNRPELNFESMTEEYPRFPDIHDLHIEFEDQQKIMVSSVKIISF